MHVEPLRIDIQESVDAGSFSSSRLLSGLCLVFIAIGIVVFAWAYASDYPNDILWGSYFINILFWMGLGVGAVMTTTIFQIVRATWAVPVRRVAEAHLAFIPWAFGLFFLTYFGKEHLYPWANKPMPGREWWMQPDFVYLRFLVLFAVLGYLLYRYVRHSLRSDVGYVREKASDNKRWRGPLCHFLSKNWDGDREILNAQRRMSILAPVVVIAYTLIWTLFATELLMSIDYVWYSNMFGGFQFLGNIYMGWAAIAVWALYLTGKSEVFSKILSRRQLWDLGMLMLGFCMLWGYTFFAQFLVHWYGNLPEDTQFLIVRLREFPWKPVAYLTFSCAFIIPFILLLSEDVKKTPKTLIGVACIIFIGVWLEKYMLVMPQLRPDMIPFGFVDIGLFLGMAGVYGLSVQGFLNKFPIITVSHPQASNETKSW